MGGIESLHDAVLDRGVVQVVLFLPVSVEPRLLTVVQLVPAGRLCLDLDLVDDPVAILGGEVAEPLSCGKWHLGLVNLHR